MAGAPGSLSAAITGVDSGLTVLDDRTDAEDRAEFLWMRAHLISRNPHHRVVIGTETLTADWSAKTLKFSTGADSAETYLKSFTHVVGATHTFRILAERLTLVSPVKLTDAEVITTLADALWRGRAWVIELPRHNLKSRFITKTDPIAFVPINPRYGTKVDFAFIASLEGDQWLRGYVPMSKGTVLGRSGMTVASGFDVGQWTPTELQHLGFPSALLNKIKLFAAPNNFKGLTKAKVAERVGKLGPVPELTKAEADLCDGAVFGKILGDALKSWNSDADKGVPKFTDLPAGWQTVWLSRVYQEGGNPRGGEAIAFRAAATAGKWQDAIKKLRGYTQYGDRAKAEAKLLEKELPVTPGAKPAVPAPIRIP